MKVYNIAIGAAAVAFVVMQGHRGQELAPTVMVRAGNVDMLAITAKAQSTFGDFAAKLQNPSRIRLPTGCMSKMAT